ncbi:MAG: glycosyltransferase [Anaerosomatales bacterium]|nr:glycosyltransferase [Anaerosomatales bacterium]
MKRIAHHIRAKGGIDFALINSGLDWKSVLRDVALVCQIREDVRVIVLQPHGSQAQRLTGSGSLMFKQLVARLIAQVDAVFLLSSEEVNQVQRFAPRARVHHVKNPYDPAWLQSSRIPIREGQFNVLFVGRVVREKGVLDLVSAAADVDGRGALDVTLVGAGPEEDGVRRLVRDLGLERSVRLAGLADAAALREAYASADVLALPSYTEGFPTVVAEAMGFGLPVVCTRIRGLADYLTDGVHTIFVEPGDPAGLRQALLNLRDDIGLRRQMSENNLRLVREFRPSTVAGEYRGIINELIARKRSAAPML